MKDTPKSITELLEDEFGSNFPSKSVPVPEKISTNTRSNSLGEISYSEWKALIDKNFPGLLLSAQAGLSLVAQLLIEDVVNPCALVLVDVPSSGKTITLNMFAHLQQSYTTDNFTPSAFVSQAANVKKEKLNEVDLLPRIKNKLLIVRDLAPIFGQRDDDLLRSMGVLTRVMDGEGLQLDAGVHGQRGYVGEYNFMLLAASTPIPPKIFKLMGNLGSRLFFLSIRSKGKDEKELVTQLLDSDWKQKQDSCSEATTQFVDELFKKYSDKVSWDKNSDPKEVVTMITRAAMLLARLRGTINVWKESSSEGAEYSYQEPVIEMPDRITQILYNIARGHALVCGRTQVSNEDLPLILNIALDSAPSSRTKIFRLLIKHKGTLSTQDVVNGLNCSNTTANTEMEKLKILGVVSISTEASFETGRPQKTVVIENSFRWFASDDFLKAMEAKER